MGRKRSPVLRSWCMLDKCASKLDASWRRDYGIPCTAGIFLIIGLGRGEAQITYWALGVRDRLEEDRSCSIPAAATLKNAIVYFDRRR